MGSNAGRGKWQVGHCMPLKSDAIVILSDDLLLI